VVVGDGIHLLPAQRIRKLRICKLCYTVKAARREILECWSLAPAFKVETYKGKASVNASKPHTSAKLTYFVHRKSGGKTAALQKLF
jgi:hypothetical protein